MASDTRGPLAYKNWKKYLAQAPLQETVEYPLFTDAHIVGEIRKNCGPYELLNAVPIPPHAGTLAPAIVGRADYYLDQSDYIGTETTNVDSYHGGTMSDDRSLLGG